MHIKFYLENQKERPPGRPTHTQEGNIKKNFKEIGCESVDWIPLAQDKIQ
jgi:hypothetical protein